MNAAPRQQGGGFTAGEEMGYSGNLPKEEGQGLEKGLEVVVMVYCAVLNQLDVSKHLKKQESRWVTSTWTLA